MNVFFVWNSWSILEFMLSIKNYQDYYVCIDSYYNKNNKDIHTIVSNCVENKIFKKYINIDDLANEKIDILVTKSLVDDFNEIILNTLNYKKLIFLEEGLSDYTKEDFYIPDNVDIYVNNTIDLKYSLYYNNIYQIKRNETIIKTFFDIVNFNTEKLYSNIDLIVFTSPIDEDYNYNKYESNIIKYLEQNYKNKNIAFKKHPRDKNTYLSKKYNLVEIDKNIPGQFIAMYYNCEKLFCNISTVLLSINESVSIIRFSNIDDILYKKFFNYNFTNKHTIINIGD